MKDFVTTEQFNYMIKMSVIFHALIELNVSVNEKEKTQINIYDQKGYFAKKLEPYSKNIFTEQNKEKASKCDLIILDQPFQDKNSDLFKFVDKISNKKNIVIIFSYDTQRLNQ